MMLKTVKCKICNKILESYLFEELSKSVKHFKQIIRNMLVKHYRKIIYIGCVHLSLCSFINYFFDYEVVMNYSKIPMKELAFNKKTIYNNRYCFDKYLMIKKNFSENLVFHFNLYIYQAN